MHLIFISNFCQVFRFYMKQRRGWLSFFISTKFLLKFQYPKITKMRSVTKFHSARPQCVNALFMLPGKKPQGLSISRSEINFDDPTLSRSGVHWCLYWFRWSAILNDDLIALIFDYFLPWKKVDRIHWSWSIMIDHRICN